MTRKQEDFIEGVVQHGNATRAAMDAGYSPRSARFIGYENLTKPYILERIERRRAGAIQAAQIHTDVIVGSLVEIAMASVGDFLDVDGELSLQQAKNNALDHLIKRVEKTTRYDKDGGKTETVKFELYSRLDALNQLRDTFGIKQEPRMVNKGKSDEIMRMDLEQSLAEIESEEGCSRSEAVKKLKQALGEGANPALLKVLAGFIEGTTGLPKEVRSTTKCRR